MDRGLPRPPRRTYLDAHLSSLCTALLWKLGGIMTSHRSRVFFCILFHFFFLHKKETQPKEPHGSSVAGGPSWLRGPGEEAAAETPQHSTLSVQSDPQEGGKKPKKTIFAH